jgi:hypothetical protein
MFTFPVDRKLSHGLANIQMAEFTHSTGRQVSQVQGA